MSLNQKIAKNIELGLYNAARGVSKISYPLSWEKLEIDENRSLWAAYTPNYKPNPPLTGNHKADLCIIGGGYTGISTAYHFSQQFPSKRVILLEAKSLANGASGRNGGMMLNWIYGTGPMDDGMTQRVYGATHQMIEDIESIIKKHDLEVSYRRAGCFEVFRDQGRANQVREKVRYLNSIGIPIQFLEKDAVHKNIKLNGVYGGLFDPSEGQLNGVQFIRELKPILEERGVVVFENSPVTKINEGKQVEVLTQSGSITADAIVLATNGYTGKLGYFRKSFSRSIPTSSLLPHFLMRSQKRLGGMGRPVSLTT